MNTKKLRTLQSWNSRGYKVKKGSKAVSFNEKGIALFSKKQVEKRDHYYPETYPCNYRQDRFYFGGENPDQMDYDLGLCGQD